MIDDIQTNPDDNHRAEDNDGAEKVVMPEKPQVEERTENRHEGKSKRALHREIDRLKQEFGLLQNDFEAQRDRHLRLAAEFDNFRKRSERDFQARVQMSLAEFYLQLLPIVDDLERSVYSLRAGDPEKRSADAESMLNGLDLILQNFRKILESRGVKAMETLGAVFDPSKHDALTQIDGNGQESQIVVEEHVKGYMLNDRVLRPAKVIISK
jgi:molecular chaperone GrpE